MTHPVDEFVGARIRAERLRAGFSQDVLASGIGVKFQQVQKYETGKNRVSCSRLWEISRVLDVPVESFLPETETGEYGDVNDAIPERISNEEERYIRGFVKLGKRDRDIVMSLIAKLGANQNSEN
jgi:transcriptional regulator with XRE-family HTH domain